MHDIASRIKNLDR